MDFMNDDELFKELSEEGREFFIKMMEKKLQEVNENDDYYNNISKLEE